MTRITDKVTALPGVGEKRAAALARLGIITISDLLRHFPRGYQNRGASVSLSDAAAKERAGLPASVLLTVASDARSAAIRRGMTITKVRAVETDFPESTLSAELTFFNQPYLKDRLRVGQTIRVWGKFKLDGRTCRSSSPICEFYTGRETLIPITPVYPLGAGLTQGFISKLIGEALSLSELSDGEVLPEDILREHELCSFEDAVRMIHRPRSVDEPDIARRRFSFEQIFITAAALSYAGARRPDKGAVKIGGVSMDPYLSALPFRLTECQTRAVDDIAADLDSTRPMKRIISGDVGSGKTAVAAAAAYICAKAGFTCALMTPTEILAKQHYADIAPLFSTLGIRSELLTGSTSKKERERILSELASGGNIGLIIGTHALLSEKVRINGLGLVITDEQHRFGVMQRAALEGKAGGVHTLVMSATPIPRTLTLVMYGDLDVSVLNELPPGRIPVSTFAVNGSFRKRIRAFIKKQADEGHRSYVVCPAVEDRKSDSAENMADTYIAEDLPIMAAVDYAAELSEALPELKIGYVHGKLRPAERDRIMSEFADGKLDVLVSTTVIEVGVNVPSATLMVVENAERFGLSQLHQLRGRVGRGNAKSYCVLVSDSTSETALERLEIMCKNRDGYKIAEEDLKLRGPGDFFAIGGAIRQSGSGNLIYSAATADPELISAASVSARKLTSLDPNLEKPGSLALKKEVNRLIRECENIIN